MRLYADDAVLQSPLVRHLLGGEQGVVEERQTLRAFVTQVFARTPDQRRRHRSALQRRPDGHLGIPRLTPSDEQLDLVESMDVRDGRIQHHRVYWGWLGVKVLEADGYRSNG